jgi:hypothetical protein
MPSEDERPFAIALGDELKALHWESRLTWQQVAERSLLSQGHLQCLCAGRKRTRRSTLTRLVSVFVEEEPWLGPVDDTVDYLCEIAGPALAAETDYPQKMARTLARRERRWTREGRIATLRAWRDSFGAYTSYAMAYYLTYPESFPPEESHG